MGNMLFAAVGSNVYTIDCLNNFKTQLVADSDNGRRAICFASNPLDNKIYIGYSFHADKKSACLVKIYEDNALQPVENSLWKYADGWYRSIEFSQDGRYIFCTGLKEQNTDGNWQNISVLFDSDFNQLAILEGHTDSVMKGVFLSQNESQLVMATCSYDCFVNIYQADISVLGKETRLSPAQTSPNVNSRIVRMQIIYAFCFDKV
jgi:WD40 repeat protein